MANRSPRDRERPEKWHLPTASTPSLNTFSNQAAASSFTLWVPPSSLKVTAYSYWLMFDFPTVGYSDNAVLSSGKRSLAISVSTNDGARLYFDNAAYPNGGEFNQRENRTAAYETWELTPCSYAQFRYKSLGLVYKEGRINIWVDNKTDDSYVLPVKVTNNGRTSYQFYVATHNVNATVSNIISERFFRVRLPGVKHVLLEKTGYHKDQSGSIVLEMSVVKEGRLIGNVSVKAKSSKEKVVPELLAQALFDGSLDLS